MATVRVDTSELVKLRERFAKMREQLPFATAQALTQTAQAGQAAVRQEMTRVFDRPTPYILDSTFIKPATKTNLEAHVYLKDIAGKAIAPAKAIGHEVTGGGRAWKRSEGALRNAGLMGANENAVPGQAAKLDAYGNMDRGQIIQIIAYFQAFGEQGYKANTTRSKRDKLAKGTKAKGGMRYFLKRDGRGRGIYMSEQSFGRWSMRPVLMFVRRAQYQRRLDMQRVVQDVARAQFGAWFADSWAQATRSAR
ncbi:MAG TPA: hypothetical protein PKV97_17765 [Thauera aminoaromatica]|nr:hypothetical protein [Thauera aminoaromatica]